MFPKDRTDMHGNSRVTFIFAICLALIICLILFRRDLLLLFTSDPPKQHIYELTFHAGQAGSGQQVVTSEGFINQGQGLSLAPGSSGKIIFSFNKELQQGCLLRVWMYGDDGTLQPNAIGVSADGGKKFRTIAENGNFIGSVFNLSPFVSSSKQFLLLFTAANHTGFTPAVVDKVEVIIAAGKEAQPPLPNLPKMLGVFFLLFLTGYFILLRRISAPQVIKLIMPMAAVLLAAYLRWNELARMAGALLEPDAQDYLNYAQIMSLFTRTGFYSGEFGFREPLYILGAKLLCSILGYSETHLRMVSFIFSLAVVYLTYKIGKEWFSPIAGLAAALIIAIHPSLIALSARGLREELFTALLLLFVYIGFIRSAMPRLLRLLLTGLLMGAILLVRSESIAALMLLLLCFPLCNKQRWNYRMVAAAAAIGFFLLLPHLSAMNTKFGDPFAAFKHHARFYANLEFAGQPGFPSKEEIAEKGMYTGPPISPFQYYFNYHTPWQLIQYTTIGFAKITCAMPFAFASETGNMRRIIDTVKALPPDAAWRQRIAAGGFVLATIAKNFTDYFMLGFIVLTFLAGVLLLLRDRCWMMVVCLVAVQLQTAFVGYLNIDKRLTVPAYPLIALCCGYAIARMFTRFHPVSSILDIGARCLTYFVTK